MVKVATKLAIVGVLILDGCSQSKRDFFQNMNPSISDIQIGNGDYFLKSFSLEENVTKINGINYWKLTNSENSYFGLRGYLRKVHDSILFLPMKYNEDRIGEQRLFDFSKSVGNSWNVLLRGGRGAYLGDSVVLSKKYVANRDSIFVFQLYGFVLGNNKKRFIDPVFTLELSKINGFVSISQLDATRTREEYKAILYPKQKFINSKGRLMDL